MIILDRYCSTDLLQPVMPQTLRDSLANGDKYAHRFHVALKIGSADSQITGSVVARFLRADGETVIFDGEAENGSTAAATLPPACYAVPGWGRLSIRVIDSEAMTTVFVADVLIEQNSSDEIIDPGDVVPNIDELLAKIEEMEAATQAAREAAEDVDAALDSLGDVVQPLNMFMLETIDSTYQGVHRQTVDGNTFLLSGNMTGTRTIAYFWNGQTGVSNSSTHNPPKNFDAGTYTLSFEKSGFDGSNPRFFFTTGTFAYRVEIESGVPFSADAAFAVFLYWGNTAKFGTDDEPTIVHVTMANSALPGMPPIDQAKTAVDYYARTMAHGGGGVELDRTLTRADAAAPADMVGELSSEMSALMGTSATPLTDEQKAAVQAAIGILSVEGVTY